MVERSPCGSGGCVSCPFSSTEEAWEAENSGCLPEKFEILKMPEEHKVNWGCHSEVGVVCGGFAQEYTERGNKVDSKLPIVDFDEFLYLGLEPAIALAKVRNGINPLQEVADSHLKNGVKINLFDYSKK